MRNLKYLNEINSSDWSGDEFEAVVIHKDNFDDREPRGCYVKSNWIARIFKAIAWVAVAYVTIYSIASIAFNAAMLPIADMINKAVPDISTLGADDGL